MNKLRCCSRFSADVRCDQDSGHGGDHVAAVRGQKTIFSGEGIPGVLSWRQVTPEQEALLEDLFQMWEGEK